MNQKQSKTLSAIFADPIRANIAWSDVESMLSGAGAVISEGRGSRVRVELNGVAAVFHRPHPQKETKKAVIRALRDYLREAEVEPIESDEPEGSDTPND